MKPIDFHPDAALEAKEAAVYYEEAREGLGIDFRDELSIALDRIQSNPKMFAQEDGAIRVGSLKRFPYVVYFEELEDRIWIAAVAHHRRRPGYWKSRSK